MKILLPVDGSDAALNAVRHALYLRRAGLQASFVLANVQPPNSLYEMVTAPDVGALDQISADAGAHALAGAEALFQAAGVPFTREIAVGDPAHTLIDIAERHGCKSIILGAKGRGALSAALHGSVSHALLHAASVPVTVVRYAP